MNKRSMFIVIGLALVAVLALTYGLAVAQDRMPGVEPAGPEVTTGSVDPYLPVQGRLTDASGNPLNGTYTMTFRLYAASAGGAALCTDTNSNVPVNNGLFNTNIWGNCYG